MAATHIYTPKEEIANAITHGIGAILSIVAVIVLVVFASSYGTALHVMSFLMYGLTMLLLYVSSTLVHSFPQGKIKDLFEILDHSSIYLFIAGSYTPITLHIIQGSLGWILFGTAWGLAGVGVLFKVFFTKKFLFTSTILYVVMGWIIILAWKPLIANFGGGGLALLLTGGILYTLGSLFYVWRGFIFHHAVWHLFVLAGSTFHFFAIFFYVLPA